MYTSEALPGIQSPFYAGERYYANAEDARRARIDLANAAALAAALSARHATCATCGDHGEIDDAARPVNDYFTPSTFPCPDCAADEPAQAPVAGHARWCNWVLTSGDGRVREACDCGESDTPQRDLAVRLADDRNGVPTPPGAMVPDDDESGFSLTERGRAMLANARRSGGAA